MSDAIWIADAEGRTLRVNDAFLRVHRFSDPLPKDMSLKDYFAHFLVRRTDGTAVVHTQWPGACALRGETARERVLEVQRSDTGETWLMSYSYAPIMGEGGASIAGAISKLQARACADCWRSRTAPRNRNAVASPKTCMTTSSSIWLRSASNSLPR
jgi:PAS domain-containing protein